MVLQARGVTPYYTYYKQLANYAAASVPQFNYNYWWLLN